MSQSAPEDFKLGDPKAESADSVLSDPRWTLYCLDLQRMEARFVKSPEDIDLTQAPFLFQDQYKFAQEVLSIDFATFHKLAATLSPDSSHVVFIHSVGRCGSTLLSKVLGSVPGICSLSEPDPATQLTEWRSCKLLPEKELLALADSSTRFACKAWPARGKDSFWAFKYRAQCIEISDMLMTAFPRAKQLFIHREPLSWLESVFRAFADKDAYRDPEFAAFFEEIWARWLPLIRTRQRRGKPMAVSETWMLVWIGVRETLARHKATGLPFHELSYESLQANPESVLKEVFKYCGIEVSDWSRVLSCLQHDSQAGTTIARDQVKHLDRSVPESGYYQAKTLLKRWNYSISGNTRETPESRPPTNVTR